MSLFTSCFPSRPTHQPLATPRPPPSYPLTSPSCVFCDIPSNVPSSSILYEDDDFYVFKDRSGGAKQHLLCIPKGHVSESVQDLSSLDIPLLQNMSSLSLSILSRSSSSPPPSPPPLNSTPNPSYLLGFHIPPLTSVPHLHLHAFELPFDDLRNRVGFRSTVRKGEGKKGKGLGWFVDVQQVMDMLEAGMKVTVGRGKVPARKSEPLYRD
ncbi:scavenger mRNA decapping enzyme C-term binding-domain-containing protein [Mrakia frigida]|uniref:scavenger mRNA decapping enzyme C-term binding-domain-containing protein n=1 Tax=Mrakia frigida TaxID=29902 RepID=UPI003FCC1B89